MLSRRDLYFGLVAAGIAAGVSSTIRPAQAATDPYSLLDPDLREAAKRLGGQPQTPFTREVILASRKVVRPTPSFLPRPTVEERKIPGRHGDPDVRVQVIGANDLSRLRPALLHIHGGGYILGAVEDMTAFCQQVAVEFDCVVINVEYRLAPETAFPGPLEDCYAALSWIYRNASSLGVDRKRIAVMGESAGGGLAAMVAIAARDRHEVPLCLQILLYPMLDDRTGSVRPVPPFIGTFGWNAANNKLGWSYFLGVPAGGRRVPAGAVPARESNLAGLAPTFIGVGGLDLFVDEDIQYARRLVNAGVPTRVHLTPGAFHAFDFVEPKARVSREFTAAWKSELKRAFSR